MKNKFVKSLGGLAAAAAMLTASSATAEVNAKIGTYHKLLSAVPAPEIPAQAASLVAQAGTDQKEAAIAVTQAATKLAPAVMPEVVGSISKSTPGVAPIVAAEAASLQPKQAATIARAAAKAAPAQAAAIVVAVSKKLPKSYSNVAMAVASAVPGSDQAILAGLAEAFPSFKPILERAIRLAAANGSTFVNSVIPRTIQLAGRGADPTVVQAEPSASALSEAAGPILADEENGNQGVRFVPGGGKPGETNRNKVIVVEKGKGRDKDYSTP